MMLSNINIIFMLAVFCRHKHLLDAKQILYVEKIFNELINYWNKNCRKKIAAFYLLSKYHVKTNSKDQHGAYKGYVADQAVI